MVMNPVADCRIVECCQRVQETSREPSEATVAQPHIVLLMAKLLVIQPEFFKRVDHIVVDAGTVEAVGKQTPHQELERQVVDPFDILVVVDCGGGNHPFHNHALNGLRCR